MVRVNPLPAPPLEGSTPVAVIRTTPLVDQDAAYLVNFDDPVFGVSTLVMVVHPSVPITQYPEILSSLLKRRDEHNRRLRGEKT